jgi:Fe-S cluster biogenesis protein NfuA
MKDQVIKVLDEQIRPGLQRDGGDIELVDVDEKEGVVQVRLKGACGGCPMATYTMVGFVEATIKKEIPGITKVVPV